MPSNHYPLWDKLRAIFGSQSELARRLNVERGVIAKWKSRGSIPAQYAIVIERLSDRQVTRHEIRPDLYPIERVA